MHAAPRAPSIPTFAEQPLASQSPRSLLGPLAILPSVFLSGIGYVCDLMVLTDIGFAWMSACCAFLFMFEAWHFRRRQGWGALTMHFGILIWFCHDYFTHWFNNGPWCETYPHAMHTIAWMAFLHCLFVTFMTLGLALRIPDRAIRWIHRYPEPSNPNILLWSAVGTFVLNLGFNLVFANYTDLYSLFWSLFFGGRTHNVSLSVGFTGNLNTSASAYLTLLPDLIRLGGIMGAAYAVFAPAPMTSKITAILVWIYSLLLAYGSGTRGQVVSQGLPMLIFLTIHTLNNPRFLKTALIAAGVIVGALVIMIQIQTYFRSQTLNASIQDVEMVELQGNTMFSEALDSYQVIPDQKPFFHNRYLGEGALRAIPQMVFWFAIHPIPRPLWKGKPIDPAWAARAEDGAYDSGSHQGTTSSQGLVGAWYFRFGLAGVVEGGILMGWLFAWCERMMRSLQLDRNPPLRSLLVIFLLLTLLLFYRDIVYLTVWPAILAFGAMGIMVRYFIQGKTHRG